MAKGDNFQKRAVVQKTPGEITEHQVRLQPERFNSLVFDKGHDAWIDRAYRCPCSVKGAGQPLADCDNCLGNGWIFANRIDTRVAIQGMKADVRFENWTKMTAGMAKITTRAIDKLAFMDRIILKEVEGYYNEILRTRVRDGKVIAFFEYPLLEVEDVMLFRSSKQSLTILRPEIDFTIEGESKIIFNLPLKDDYTLTTRYRHYMTYHILEMNRDIMKVRTKDKCGQSDEELAAMPISGVARKAHYLFDNHKFDEEERLIDNSRT